jgi:hypothetical protein
MLMFSSAAFAQGGMHWRGSGGWSPHSRYGGMFDPKTVETIRGEVVSVEKITPMRGMSSGVHMVVRTDKASIPVHLGPDWFIENQDVKLEPKDQVEVTGSVVTFDGKPAMIATEVRKGDEVLTLRDEDGRPMWSGWRRGR